jgi:hypothetical protein
VRKKEVITQSRSPDKRRRGRERTPRKELKEIGDGNWYSEIPDLEGVWLSGISVFERGK